MTSNDREKINSKLINLVKRHEILYNRQHANMAYFESRRELWKQITKEMNETFKMKSHPEDWKCKWREMRAYYIRSSEKTRNAVKRNPIFDELKFLRPYIDAVKSGQPMSSKTARNSETDNAQARSIRFDRNRMLGDTNDNENVLQHKDDAMKSCFEITIEDEDEDATNEAPITTQTHPPPDSIDDEGDKMFGMLIVGELRKMTPAEQKAFKRNVTRLLYY